VYRQNLDKQVNLNAVIIYAVTGLATTAVLGVFIIPLDVLVKIPDLSLSRRIGIPYSPMYGLVRAIWCLLHGNLDLAVRYNKLIFFFFPTLIYQYMCLIQQCFRCRLFCESATRHGDPVKRAGKISRGN
jgi:Protein of unknown function (DUF2752)